MLCAQCRNPIPADNPGLASPARTWRGRPRLYCGDACRQRAYRARRTTPDTTSTNTSTTPEPATDPTTTARALTEELLRATANTRKALPTTRATPTARAEALRRAAAHAADAARLAQALAALLSAPDDPTPPPQG